MSGKKLIEVTLPLKEINDAAAREKSIRHGHPSTLHLWWARRPLAAARAVIWASLVDDPSAHPELFPTEEEQRAERDRLFDILKELVIWEHSNDETVLGAAKAEILRYTTEEQLPALLDPFAGGGAIPLEAQRLGLEAHAHDLNPVAVMINKAMIEIPPMFAGCPPVNPDVRRRGNFAADGWRGAAGLAEDVRYYGEWMKQEAYQQIGHLYPKVKIPKEQGGGEGDVIAWIWTRTVKCPNLVCGCEMPLASSFVLSKKGQGAYVEPQLDYENRRITYRVHNGSGSAPESGKAARGAKFRCVMCSGYVDDEYIKQESCAGRMGAELMAIVAEKPRKGRKKKLGRLYITPDEAQRYTAECPKPEEYPDQSLPYDPRNIWCVNYGLDTYDKLFTNRQLTALTTFCNLVAEAQKQAETDGIAAGLPDDHIPLREGGTGAKAYGEAIGVYLSFVINKLSDRGSTICSWDASREGLRNTFGRQAIPMVWDYAEANPFCDSSGSFNNMLEWVYKSVNALPAGKQGYVRQSDAKSASDITAVTLSTDPPYYDNIGYADLSDFFYVWMRKCIRNTYPALFSTVLVPKNEELIATPYRHNGDAEKAKAFFESGMLRVCRNIFQSVQEEFPVTVYYAYKQSKTDIKESTILSASSGWETMLSAIIHAGFTITGTWPMRTEMANRQIASGTNALASSIVLVCRKRPEDAPKTTRRNLIKALRRELRPALQKLQESNIAPVDLAQSAIGPGMAVFSRYSCVLEADGKPMRVRDALQIINEELDIYFNEQGGDLDLFSRFCVDFYTQNAYNPMKYGLAEVLANAKGVSIPLMVSHGFLYAQGGEVRLLEREELPEKVDSEESCIWLLAQQLTYAMEKGGITACAEIVYSMYGSNTERAKELVYRLFTIAEKKRWTAEGYAYNALVSSWSDIQTRAAGMKLETPVQLDMFDEDQV